MSIERPRRERVREQLRQQTTAEIEQAAFDLLDAGGVAAVSLAAVGKAMGMTAPGLYRYFPSREALVDALVTAAYAELGEAIVAAAGDGQVARIAHGYRRWALDHPRRYMLLFGDRLPGAADPADGVIAVNRGMQALVGALAAFASDAEVADGGNPALDRALVHWAAAIEAPSAAPPVLRHGVLLWARVHGLVTLEITGAFAAMGLDAEQLLDAEVAAVLQALS